MVITEFLKKRRSIRKFAKGQKINGRVIQRILETAIFSPSAGNLQSYFIVVVEDPLTKVNLADVAFSQNFIAEASVVFVVCADLKCNFWRYGIRGRELYALQDATLAAFHLWLLAAEEGLAGCWVGAFDEDEVKRICRLAEHLRPVVLLPVGYPDESPVMPSRKKAEELCRRI